MPWIERDEEDGIRGLYEVRQPGRAEEWLEDDDAEVVDFRSAGPWEDV